MNPADLSAADAVTEIARGALTAEALTAACLDRIAERNGAIGAFAFVDRDHALASARALDEGRRSGRAVGPLHGVPVAVKDILDTADMPTENGTAIDEGRRPRADAAAVSRLRAAGAVIIGKTVTTELAFSHPSRTRNPVNLAHSPGGSSSGSAAAVAAHMVPLAVGTQTNGSVIRPAAYCGVVGYKPTFGLVPRTGVLKQTDTLDTIGGFARTLSDVARLVEAMQGFDAGDPHTAPRAPEALSQFAESAPPSPPRFAFVRTPVWDRADADAKALLCELANALGPRCDAVELPDVFANAHAAHRCVMVTGFAHNLRDYGARGFDLLSPAMREAIAEGRSTRAVDHLSALDWQGTLAAALEPIFDRYDAILTLPAPGAAPEGFATTGDPAFNTIWTFCGVPAITLPLGEGRSGLPLGVQLIGRRGADARLLRIANALIAELAGADQTPEGKS